MTNKTIKPSKTSEPEAAPAAKPPPPADCRCDNVVKWDGTMLYVDLVEFNQTDPGEPGKRDPQEITRKDITAAVVAALEAQGKVKTK
jgi:hypothetical protein